MTKIETLLEQRSRDWSSSAAPPPPLGDFVARATSTPRAAPHRLMPALAAATILVVAIVPVIIVANRHDSGATRPGSSAGLTASQRSLAIRIALRAASGSNPNDPGPVNLLTSWPSYVDTAAAAVLPYRQARQLLDGNGTAGASGAGTPDTLVVRLTGRFAVITTGPAGNSPISGNVITLLTSLKTGRGTDSGIDDQSPPRELPHQTLLYERFRFPDRSVHFLITPARPQDLSSAAALSTAQRTNSELNVPPGALVLHGILTDTANDQTPVWAFRYHSCEAPHAPIQTKNALCTRWVFVQSETGAFIEARYST